MLIIFYFIFSIVFIIYEDKENLRKPQLSQKVISRPVLFQSYVRMTNALRTHDGSMTSFLYIAYTLSQFVYIRSTGPQLFLYICIEITYYVLWYGAQGPIGKMTLYGACTTQLSTCIIFVHVRRILYVAFYTYIMRTLILTPPFVLPIVTESGDCF